MAGRYTELSKALTEALRSELSAESNLQIDRRLLPRMDRNEFAADTTYVSVFAAENGFEIVGRQVDEEQWEAVIAIQAAQPGTDAAAGANPLGNVTSRGRDDVEWGDAVFDLVERVKDLWRASTSDQPAGALRNQSLAGCTFVGLEHSPVYMPYHLEQLGVLSIILQLTYQVSDEFDDE